MATNSDDNLPSENDVILIFKHGCNRGTAHSRSYTGNRDSEFQFFKLFYSTASASHRDVSLNCVTAGDKSAMIPGGVRIGTPALTTRGFLESDFDKVR